jgi:hypothetical protein
MWVLIIEPAERTHAFIINVLLEVWFLGNNASKKPCGHIS